MQWVLPQAVVPLIITLLLITQEQGKNDKHCFCWEVKEFNFLFKSLIFNLSLLISFKTKCSPFSILLGILNSI